MTMRQAHTVAIWVVGVTLACALSLAVGEAVTAALESLTAAIPVRY